MSCYLFAFFIGQYEFIQIETKRGVPVRGYAPKGRAEETRESIDVAAKALDFYEELFGIPYPLPKLDLINSFKNYAPAMENWGAMLMRSDRFLFSKELKNKIN